MEKIYALIRSGVVENTIIGDDSFAEHIAPNWDYVIRIDDLDPRPGIGWIYDNDSGDFLAPE